MPTTLPHLVTSRVASTPMRILVTGGAGYVGSHVVRALQRAEHSVVVVDDLSTGSPAFADRNGVELLEGDVGDAAFLEGVFGQHTFDLVVHCAGRAVVGESVREPDRYFAVNTVAGYVLLEAMRRHGVTKILFSSTCSVYGVPESLPVTEETPTQPTTPYGASKLAFEHMLSGYARAYGFRALALRYFNVGGASSEGDLGDLNASGTRLIPNLLGAARRGEPCSVFGHNYPTRDGSGERDYIHVEDLARAHAQAVGRFHIMDLLGFGGALNLGMGRGYTVREVLAEVESQLGETLMVREVPRRPGDPPALVADASLAGRILGFRADHDLSSIVRSARAFEERERQPGGLLFERERRLQVQVASGGGSMRLGEAVVKAGFVDQEGVDKALDIQRDRDGVGEPHQLLGLILLETGAISSAQLIRALRSIGRG